LEKGKVIKDLKESRDEMASTLNEYFIGIN